MRITNGKDILTVANGAYEAIYKHAGFYQCDVPAEPSDEPETSNVFLEPLQARGDVETIPSVDDMGASVDAFKTDLKAADDDLLDMPLSEMNVDDLRRFAEIHNVDVTGKNKKEMRDLLRGK